MLRRNNCCFMNNMGFLSSPPPHPPPTYTHTRTSTQLHPLKTCSNLGTSSSHPLEGNSLLDLLPEQFVGMDGSISPHLILMCHLRCHGNSSHSNSKLHPLGSNMNNKVCAINRHMLKIDICALNRLIIKIFITDIMSV